MRAWIGITDWEWFQFLSNKPGLAEVNFWQPRGRQVFARLNPGELFLFKLHSPRNFIVGGGVFAHATRVPISLAWDSFGAGNGADEFADFRRIVENHRDDHPAPSDDFWIGCIVLTQPFFLPRNLWIPFEKEWPLSSFGGIRYDLEKEPGRTVYAKVQDAMSKSVIGWEQPALAQDLPEDPGPRLGQPTLIVPRLGQGSFRMIVTDAYERRCAVTGEKVLPVLEAAHVRPFARAGPHRIQNGILLRSDLHTLFDRGYLTVTPDLHLDVSRTLHEDFDNGRDYYALRGRSLRLPTRPDSRPANEFLSWHNANVFRG